MKKLAYSLVVAGLLATGAAGSASAYECKSVRTLTSAVHVIKIRASRVAVGRWVSHVRRTQGLPWSVWQIAKKRKVNCNKRHGRWKCRAAAKPCKYVPTS